MSVKVHVKPSGHEFEVEAGESILDAALRHGFAFPYGCRGGGCGACKGKLLGGEIDYGEKLPPGLSAEDRAAGFALFCKAVPTTDVTVEVKEVGAIKDIPVRIMPTRIEQLEQLGDDVMVMGLKLPEGERLRFLAGQYVEFLLADGRRRAFSIANAPHDDALLQFHVRRIKGGRFTEQLFADTQVKDIVRIEGPQGSFFMRDDSDGPIIMLATGTGFGPIKAMVEHAIAEGTPRPIYVYWGARTRAGLYLDAMAQGWAEEHANIHYIPVLSQPAPEDEWHGATGHVQDVVLRDFEDLRGFDVYACGHPQMVYTAKDLLVARGLDPERCFSDAFEWTKD